MTFLNPFVLFGLIAASFPLLFHLFAQRKARRVEFSSIRFLQKLEKSSMRKVKLRQILLLILRTLLIICLVMAFSRPALRGYLGGFFGTSHANTTIVLLVDNSASMSRRNANGSYFKQATEAANEIVNAIEDGDEAVVIPLATLEPGKEYPPLHTMTDIRKAISSVTVADAPARVEDGMRVASAVLARSLNVNKEIYLISDAQARNYKKEIEPKSDSSSSRLKLFDERTRIFITDIGESEKTIGRNLSIDSLIPVTTIFEPGRPLEFNAYIRNTGDGTSENAVVSLFYNGERVAQRSVTGLGQSKSEKIAISAQPRGAGLLAVRAELEDDALPFDNKRYLSLILPLTRRIGIFVTHDADVQFLKLAL
ncbi:MAG: BatA domain-containing protein, partial [Bacteroidota bacterium]|nr:BatA domain-containing protein [Bacteroidota bacterium]